MNYAASIHYWVTKRNIEIQNIPYPVVWILADNVYFSLLAIKGCKSSFVRRQLGCQQCALTLNNPAGIATGRINTTDNDIVERV